jgi:uncharacterized protein (TIGR02284 family)
MAVADMTIDTLNSLLRGELAATETYDQALEKIDEDGIRAVLRRIRVEHYQAVQALEEHIHYFGGEPMQESGTWGAFATLAEGTARVLGIAPTLRALHAGEQQGRDDYERALEGEALPPECRGLVRTSLLPQTQAHIESLARLLGT